MVTQDDWEIRLVDDLGGEGIDVELTEGNKKTALRRTLQMWNRWKTNLRWLSLGDIGASGTIMFTLTEDQIGIAGVLDVEFADQDYPTSTPLAGSSVPTAQMVAWGRRGPRSFFQVSVSIRRMERFTGTQPDWYWDPDDRILYIYSPARPIRVMALFARPRTVEDIRFDEEHQFEELALAHVKIIAANIYEQAGETVPGPQGEIGSPAARWREEAQTVIDEITEELKQSLRSFSGPKWVG